MKRFMRCAGTGCGRQAMVAGYFVEDDAGTSHPA